MEPKIPSLGIVGLEFNKKYCHISNQHPGNCLIAKIRERIKCLNFEPKMPYLGIFGARIKKKLSLTFEISILEFVKNGFLTHTVKFCIGCAVRVEGPGALYKVCHF